MKKKSKIGENVVKHTKTIIVTSIESIGIDLYVYIQKKLFDSYDAYFMDNLLTTFFGHISLPTFFWRHFLPNILRKVKSKSEGQKKKKKKKAIPITPLNDIELSRLPFLEDVFIMYDCIVLDFLDFTKFGVLNVNVQNQLISECGRSKNTKV